MVKIYTAKLSSLLDQHAPLQTKTLTPNTEWYTDDIRKAKQDCRKAERVMLQTNLTVHQDVYREKRNIVSGIILKSKRDYYSTKIEESGHDQKQLFKLTNKLMGNKNFTILPSHQSLHELSNRFG